MIYFTSDWHFCHNKPFIYESRGFKSIEEMNEIIIENHNRVVKEEDIIYISDIVEIKTSLDEERFEFKVIDKKNIDYDKIMNDKSLIPLMERVDKVEDWRCLTEDFPDVTKTIYKDKHVFSIPVNDGEDCINIGKSIIPILTEKTISNSEYCINYLDDLSLYEVLIRYQHTHFKIYMQYFAVTMKLLED